MESKTKPLDTTPAYLWVTAGLLLVVVLGVFDYATEPGFSFLLFYLSPLFIVADRVGKRAGALIAGASAVAWSTGQLGWVSSPRDPLFHVWNTTSALILLLVVNHFIALWKGALAKEYANSWIDPVSGVGNTRYFMEMVDSEIGRSRRHGRPFALAHVDVDQLRAVNQRVGRLGGDTLLGLLGRALVKGLRKSDAVARLGGDEFTLLLSETSAEGAQIAVSRLLEKLVPIFEHDGWSVTLTIGVVAFEQPPASAEDAARLAEGQMYAAKEAGHGTLKVATWNAPVAAGRRLSM